MKELRDKICALYEAAGLPREVSSGWALPEPDTCDLMAVLLQKKPRKVLEIGSYVGMTTNMMASLLPPDSSLHAIDPNQPLDLEDRAMGQAPSCTRRPFEFGQAVARQLGVSHKVSWHEGGSTTNRTFATENSSAAPPIPLIGERVCREHGPFDFIFIDALHYEFAVKADLALAAQWLDQGGVIAVHDVLGRWGTHVRRAIQDFLGARPDFTFVHFPYASLLRGMGFLARRGEARIMLPPPAADPARGIWQPAMVQAFCGWVKGHLEVHRVVFVGPDSHGHAALLASQGHAVTHVARDPAPGCAHLPWNETGPLPPLPETELCFCLHAGLPGVEDARGLVSALCASSRRVLFSATPPGEFGVAHENARAWKSWLDIFAEHRYRGMDSPFQHLDPWLFKIYNNPVSLTNSYALCTWLFEFEEQRVPASLIDAGVRIAGMAMDALAANAVLFDAYLQIQNAGAREQEWGAWKKISDEREMAWTEWKRKVDERELCWLEWKRQADEREQKWMELKKEADEREPKTMPEVRIDGEGQSGFWKFLKRRK